MVIINKLIYMLAKRQLFTFIIFFAFSSFGTMSTETFSQENYLIKKIVDCYDNAKLKKCLDIISYAESIQLREYNKGNYRCQTSLLGAQTELIKKIYFSKNEDNSIKINIPFVIKNCKL